MDSKIILSSFSVDELRALITESIAKEFSKFQAQAAPEPDELLKLDEVATLFGVSKVTIFQWKKSGKLPFYRLSGRVYFKRSEVLDALKKIERRVI